MYTWAALLRRELLSVPHAVFRFIERAGDHTWKLWGSVRRELRWMGALLVLAFADTRRPWLDTVTATDAEGVNQQDIGGADVTERQIDIADVESIGRISEKW